MAVASAAVLVTGATVPTELALLVPVGFAFAAGLLARSRAEAGRLQIAVRESITIDELTAALNRRGLEEAARRELRASLRSEIPCSLLLCDVDNFEQLRESFGLAAAEAAVITTADRLRVTCRPRDRIGRVGDASFAVLLPETPSDAALAAAARLRTAALAAGVALSVGVAEFPHDGATLALLLEAARAAADVPDSAGPEAPSWSPEDLAGSYASSDAD
jgi:diguanylate cyclase (GGDEF)-like protein